MNRKKNHTLLLEKVKETKDIIDCSWSNSNLCIKTLAQRLGVDREALGAVFKEQYRERINARINRLRIKESERLLKKNQHKISVIASIIGFPSRIRFYQIFREKNGISPKEYQERKNLTCFQTRKTEKFNIKFP